ncbi:unnamed protein product [Eretmochelys imbricata]
MERHLRKKKGEGKKRKKEKEKPAGEKKAVGSAPLSLEQLRLGAAAAEQAERARTEALLAGRLGSRSMESRRSRMTGNAATTPSSTRSWHAGPAAGTRGSSTEPSQRPLELVAENSGPWAQRLLYQRVTQHVEQGHWHHSKAASAWYHSADLGGGMSAVLSATLLAMKVGMGVILGEPQPSLLS